MGFTTKRKYVWVLLLFFFFGITIAKHAELFDEEDACICEKAEAAFELVKCMYDDKSIDIPSDQNDCKSTFRIVIRRIEKSYSKCPKEIFRRRNLFKKIRSACNKRKLDVEECLDKIDEYIVTTTPAYPTASCKACCDPIKKPGSCDVPACDNDQEAACCPHGTWACFTGYAYQCGDQLLHTPSGRVCEDSLTFCTADAFKCPDGSFVSRDPNNCCKFKSCPDERNDACCNPDLKPGACDNPICSDGVACCPDGTWSCGTGDGTFTCGGKKLEKPQGEVCPRGCPKDLKKCEDGSILFRDPENCCKFPDCPKPSEDVCCDPSQQPGVGNNPFCFEGSVCCSDGTWSCGIGDGTFTCDGEVVKSGNGVVCPQEEEDKCCDLASKPGIFQCDEGAICCADGTWSCGIGDGTYFCGGEVVTEDNGVECESSDPGPVFCPQDVKTCPDGSYVSRDPNNKCAFPPCPACCDPVQEPGQCGNPACDTNLACCPDGSWVCQNANGDYICDELKTSNKPQGRVCKPVSALCSSDTKTCKDGSIVFRDPLHCCNFSACSDGSHD